MARVVGYVWSTVKWDGMKGLRLLLVRPYNLDDIVRAGGEVADDGAPPKGLNDGVVAADVLGAGPGEDVVVAYGHAARVGIEPELEMGEAPRFPVDAAVVAIVDKYQVDKYQVDRYQAEAPVP
ncbi:MAG: EutN/CcmL family microcompartment protein [Deltaproteobacteria bacterium]|nr:EutN/CcmL family microcompartment protein [Deltaproteobacteria bacterium]